MLSVSVAKNINLVNHKAITLQVITNNQKITEIAKINQVSRNFIVSSSNLKFPNIINQLQKIFS